MTHLKYSVMAQPASLTKLLPTHWAFCIAVFFLDLEPRSFFTSGSLHWLVLPSEPYWLNLTKVELGYFGEAGPNLIIADTLAWGPDKPNSQTGLGLYM